MPRPFSKYYFEQIFIACDQVVNAVFGGYADETISSRMYREQRKFWQMLIDNMFFWQENHCFNSYLSEKNRKHFPSAFRNFNANENENENEKERFL